tara:strand:+ start:1612 stop:2364 length:753 start_codon:yes stop_codon:yes gene_type:complete
MGLLGLGNVFNGFKGRGSRTNPSRPFVTVGTQPALTGNRAEELRAIQQSLEPASVDLPPNSSGYILITDVDDHNTTYLGRVLDFQINRASNRASISSLGRARGETEKVLLDGHIIYETQLRYATTRKLQERFMEEFDIQILSTSQVAGILADDENDPQMFGSTGALDKQIEGQIEAELDSLRNELEAEYLEQFEEDYQNRLKQEYPGMFSKDFQEHYTDYVQDELDDVVDDHEELYEEYIVTDKHIRYKR